MTIDQDVYPIEDEKTPLPAGFIHYCYGNPVFGKPRWLAVRCKPDCSICHGRSRIGHRRDPKAEKATPTVCPRAEDRAIRWGKVNITFLDEGAAEPLEAFVATGTEPWKDGEEREDTPTTTVSPKLEALRQRRAEIFDLEQRRSASLVEVEQRLAEVAKRAGEMLALVNEKMRQADAYEARAAAERAQCLQLAECVDADEAQARVAHKSAELLAEEHQGIMAEAAKVRAEVVSVNDWFDKRLRGPRKAIERLERRLGQQEVEAPVAEPTDAPAAPTEPVR